MIAKSPLNGVTFVSCLSVRLDNRSNVHFVSGRCLMMWW